MHFDFAYSGLLGVIILVLDIYAIIRVAQSNAGALSKAIWIVLIILLPVLGLILWAIFGPRK